MRRLGRRALVAEKVEGLPEVFAWRHEIAAWRRLPPLAAVGGDPRPEGGLAAICSWSVLRSAAAGGRRGRGLRGGRGGDRQLVSG